MALHIQNNVTALRAANNLRTHYSSLGRSIARLSSGLRINTAQDGPVDFAVREEMRAQIGIYTEGIRNAGFGISMLQTAENAMASIDQKLIRMKELAEQAATGTYTEDQRLIIHSEFTSMAAEIDRIATATHYSGIHLIDGNLSTAAGASYQSGGGWNQVGPEHLPADGFYQQKTTRQQGGLKIHFGLGNDRLEDYYFINIAEMSTQALFGGSEGALPAERISVSTQQSAQAALEQINQAIELKEKGRASIGAMINRLESTIDHLQGQLEQTRASESRISDIDVATEMAEFVGTQVITQAAVAMMAQANALPQMALKLLNQ